MKKSMAFIISAGLMLCLPLGSNSQGKYKWELSKTKNGCTIYTSPVEGKAFIAAKCVSEVDAGMDVIGMVLRDINSFPQWMGDCKGAKILKVVSEQNDIFIFYFHQGTPVISDRDVVLKSNVQLNYDKGYAYVGFGSTNEFNYPTPGGMVRMNSLSGQYYLKYISRDKTLVSFMIDPDLGGSVAGFVANPVIKDLPYKSMIGLKKMVKMQKYIDGAKTSKYKKMIDDAVKKGLLK